jgi:hypothetical protein
MGWAAGIPVDEIGGSMALRFAFLLLEEHPWGREMLRVLIERGYEPELIVEEVSDVAEVERGKFLTRMAGQHIPHAWLSRCGSA